jgi:hypothetical protein
MSFIEASRNTHHSNLFHPGYGRIRKDLSSTFIQKLKLAKKRNFEQAFSGKKAEKKASRKETSVPDTKHEAELDLESYNEAQKKIYKADGRGHRGGYHGIWYI